MSVRAVIVDLDRTLLHTDKEISEFTVSTMKQCIAAGILLLAATARPMRTVETLIKNKFDFAGYVAMNGAVILNGSRKAENTIPKATAELVLKKLLQIEGARISVETRMGCYGNVELPLVTFFSDFPKLPDDYIYKILVSADDEKVFEKVRKILPENTYATVANGTLMQIMSCNATKWKGIQQVLQEYDVLSEETVYFGDDYDDIEPMQKCGTGVAVANAIDEVKAVADFIADSNDEDGVAKWIQLHVLQHAAEHFKVDRLSCKGF